MKIHAIHSIKHGGSERFHKAGCRDIGKECSQEDSIYPYVFEAESILDIAEEYCQDFIAEGSWTADEAADHWIAPACAPCCSHLPMHTPEQAASASVAPTHQPKILATNCLISRGRHAGERAYILGEGPSGYVVITEGGVTLNKRASSLREVEL